MLQSIKNVNNCNNISDSFVYLQMESPHYLVSSDGYYQSPQDELPNMAARLSCGFRNVTPSGSVARTFEVVFDGIGKDIGLSLTVFLCVLLRG